MDDDDHEIVLRQVGQGLKPIFALDDAFSDGEDGDVAFESEFSSAAIRRQLAQSYSQAEESHEAMEDTAETNASTSELNTTISSFNLDGQGSHNQSRSPSLSSQLDAQDEYESVEEFSQISLTDGPADARHSQEYTMKSPAPQSYDVEGTSYPTVHVDDRSPSSSRGELSPGPPQPSDTTSRHSVSEDYSEDTQNRPHSPHSAPATSSARLDIYSSSKAASSVVPLPAATASQSSRTSRSTGPTMFQKVVSKTRPSFLPPKSRKEDRKHLADWENMMKLSRVAQEKRKKALQERRLARETRIEQSIHIWEHEILPDWRVVHKKTSLRNMWWNGIPTKLRAAMWERAVGNPLALSKDNYRTCHARAKRAISSGIFSADTMVMIEEDIQATLPTLHIFHKETGPLYQDLKDMLCAWVVSRSDEGLGYVPGISRIAAMILITMPPQQGFTVMRNLLERHCMRSFYGGVSTRDDVEAYYRIFDTLLADGMPKIYFNFKQHQISPAVYLPDWLIPLFLDHLPFEACARIWDVLLLEGDSFLFRAALAILAVLEPRLFFPDRRELLELLKGENKAALEAAKRDGRSLDGGKYEIYDLDEESLWDRIASMEDWWKESTWKRLLQRELPDL